VHLKSLRLQGFKTFARRTELSFSTGITAIVGPNGSGKSNLVDAIRWALGERTARGLRGHRMEDVIYAGGPGKSPVGMAEVMLLLDNADQRLNVEFTEIEVSRRLFRSGESEYLVNGSRARLKDIDALLASTGLRQDGYAVTAQNDIDLVIQAAPAIRRELIEEAAGVRHLRDQRQEAINRLAEAERDMARARDILNELTPRVEELRLQAQTAEEYQRIADSLKELQGSLARDAWRKAMMQLRRAHGRMQAAEQKRLAARQAVAEFEPTYGEHRKALLEAREARWRQQEALADVRLRLAEAQHQARIAQERNLAAVQALDTLQRELLRLAESEQAGSRVVDELADAVAAASAELQAANLALESAVGRERQAGDAQALRETQRSALQEQQQAIQREALAVAAELRQLEGRGQFLSDQQAQLRHQLDAWVVRQEGLSVELARRRSSASTADEALRAATSEATAIDQGVADAEAALETARKAVVEHEARLRALEAELGALRTLLDGAQRRSPLPGGDTWNRLLEVIEVEPQYRPAVEAALEGWLHGWLAPDQDGFEQAAAALQDAEHARETLLLTGANDAADGIADGLARLCDLVHAPPEVAGVLASLLQATVLVTDRAEATRTVNANPRLRAVTLAGEVVTAVSYRGGKGADALLAVQARIRDGEQSLGGEREASLRAADEVERCLGERSRQLAGRRPVLDQLDAARTAAAEAAGGLAAVSDALRRENQQEAQLRQQTARLVALSQQVEEQQVEAVSRHSAIEARDSAIVRELETLLLEISRGGASVSKAVEERQESELRAALARQRAEDLARQLERAQQVLRAHGDELAQRRAAEEELALQPALINEERRQWLERADALRAELNTLEAMPLPDDEALNNLDAQVRDDEQRNVNLQVQLAHADDACATAATERDSAQEEVERCVTALRQDGQSVEEEAEPAEEVDWQKTEREVSRLQRRLEAMGAVNRLASDEYAQVRDRCDGLGNQLHDLEEASRQLRELRERLEGEIDGRFRTVFQAVAVNFQEFFGELFPGGRATLRLESAEAGNPLDDGVEILAQTPGKRLQPLTLLSGGERALTALAFLFALQAVNPSPFYVLDEVDAALDDANVVRFNRVLKRLAANQQFLIVTHNHSTMAQAEALYGVTLGEHGISRIVSVRLHQDNLIPVGERTA
jgi:chromosome segregation protein